MCEHRIIWRYCPCCRKRASLPLRQNVNCESVTIWKLGKCRRGLCDREIEEQIECSVCYNRRIAERDEARKRLWEKAWPAPDVVTERLQQPAMQDAGQQTEDLLPKNGRNAEKWTVHRGEEEVVHQPQPEVIYDADDEDEAEDLVMIRKRSKGKEKSD